VVSDDIPHNVITMNSQVSLKDMETGETMTYTLVYPSEANLLENKISIMAPVGTAILGFCEGDIISWEVPDGVVKLQVEKILYQPEAAGDLDL
jgi:regulator of nucleoside diphosphate kinase